MTLEEQLRTELEALGVRPDDALGVACSGGADSMALVHLLRAIGVAPTVLHVDHGLRADSAHDASFVEGEAARLGLRFELHPVAVVPGDSIEAAARAARYRALHEAATRLGLRFVATAHTKDDDAETVLLRMLRGTGIEGISPARGVFVRPLLGVRRADVRSWLSERGLRWRDDPTNEDTRFERNWLRNDVMPLLEARRPGVTDVVARVGARARADAHALDDLAAEAFHAPAATDNVGVFLPQDDLPIAIRSRMVRLALRAVGVDPTHNEIDAVLALRTHTRCRTVSVWRLEGGLAFVREPVQAPDTFSLPADGTVVAPSWGVRLRVGTANETPWAWRCALPDETTLQIRSRRPGDRVATAAGTRKVQDVLTDAKIPRPLRDLVPVLANGQTALAVVGLTRSGAPQAATVLDVQPCVHNWSTEALWTKTSR